MLHLIRGHAAVRVVVVVVVRTTICVDIAHVVRVVGVAGTRRKNSEFNPGNNIYRPLLRR